MECVYKNKNVWYISPSKYLDANYLANYWSENLKLDNTNTSKCKRYAEFLVSKMGSWLEIHRHLKIHFDVNLQMNILREVFQQRLSLEGLWDFQSCKEYLDSSDEEPKLPKKLNILELFEIFVKNGQITSGCEEYTTEHLFINKEVQESLTYIRFLAIEEIFGEAAPKVFSNYQEGWKSKLPKSLPFSFINTDHRRFYHTTLAEYFVADLFLHELQHNGPEGRFQSLLVDEILSNPEYKLIRAFFDKGLQKILPTIPRNVFYYYQACSFEIDYNKEYMPCIIYLLAEEGCVATLRLLFNCINFRIPTGEPPFFSISNCFKMREYMLEACKSILYNKLTMLQFVTRIVGVNIKDEGGKEPLHYAAQSGQLDAVKFLVEHGAEVNHGDYINGFTPLYLATAEGHLEVVKYLVEHGAQANHYHNRSGKDRRYAAQLTDAGVTLRYRKEYNSLMNDTQCGYTYAIQPVASRGDLEMVTFLVQNGSPVSVTDIENNSLLHLALRVGRSDTAQFLVENDVNVMAKDSQGTTALHLADSPALVEALIAKGADVNSGDNQDCTPIYFAILSDRLDVAKALLRYGASLNMVDKEGRTSLYYAVTERKHDAVTFLLKHGADFNLRKPGDCTLLHVAILKSDFKIVADLVRSGIYLNVKDSGNRTALHLALRNGHLDAAKLLVEYGADVNIANGEGYTAFDLAIVNDYLDIVKLVANHDGKNYSMLHTAVCLGQSDIVKYLLEMRVDINCKYKNGCTLLHFAVEGKLDIVQLLVEHGANVNLQNDDGRTALHLAVLQNRLDITAFLAKDTSVEVFDNEGCSPLHLAAKQGYCNIVVKLLVDYDVDFVDGSRCTSLHLATRNGHINTIKLLLKYTKNVDMKNAAGWTALHVSAAQGNLDVIKTFVEFGADVNCKTNTGLTLLHLAARGQSIDAFKFLAERTDDVTVRDDAGNTILHLAAADGDLSIVRFVAELVEDINVKNSDGQMALHFAIGGRGMGRKSDIFVHASAIRGASIQERVQLLLELGGDATLTDKLGNTPLHVAAMCGEIGAVKLLVNRVDGSVRNEDEYTAFQLAVYNFQIEVVEYLSAIDNSLTGRELQDFLRYLNPDKE